jgi:2'-5' RNA ligase
MVGKPSFIGCSTGGERMRLFFAVPVSESVKDIVWDAIRSFPVDDPPWRWIPPQNYHLTVKFLGEVDEVLIPSINEAAIRAASRASPFDMVFGGFGGFPSLSKPRVLFYRIEEGAGELESLAGDLERAMEPLGFEREGRRFKAHLTLARVRRPLSGGLRRKLDSVPPLPGSAIQEVDRFLLMRSHLNPKGATYEEIGAFRLGPAREH